MKKLCNGWDSIKAVEKGVTKLCDLVKLTMGPKGKNVAIERKYTFPLITNDGVTIAKEIELEDSFENIGAQIIKEASIKTNDLAGDGTTTACVLTNAIVHEGVKNYSAGANAVILKQGIKLATDTVVNHLQSISKSVSTDTEIFQVASISAGSDEIGHIISEAFAKVGRDGVITVDEGKTLKTELKIVEGMQFDRGYLSAYMVTDTNKMTANLTNPLVLVSDQKITNINDILHLLEAVSSSGRPLLIIADDFDTEVVNTLVINKLRGSINVVCVKAPAYADRKSASLQDICALVGSKLVSTQLGVNFKDISVADLGSANTITITKDTTTITGGHGDPKELNKRIDTIKAQLTDDLSDFDREKLLERLAKLTGGIAVVLVGAATEIELQEKKLRIEDAISATKSAVEEGIICGGGVALISALPVLDKLIETLNGDVRTGAMIVRNAITEPLITIATNAGINGGVVLDKVIEGQKTNINYGYDALNNTYGDMLKCGIIDPTKVTRCALQNASSVASTLLTLEGIICNNE